MKTIVMISGKGGTGKTVTSASFAALARKKILVDCDVDAADLHLLLHPEIRQRHVFQKGQIARIDPSRCVRCGQCRTHCRFAAIRDDFSVDELACEGCGLCARICPVSAVTMEDNTCGEWFFSDTRFGPMVHADLYPGEENSGKLVAKIREVARQEAERQDLDYILIDGSPGIGCPVIASLSGADLALIVTEPTLSGIHDLDRVLAVTRHFGIPARVIINKYDLNQVNTLRIEETQRKNGLEVLGRIPFSKSVPESVVRGVPLVEYAQDDAAQAMRHLWEKTLACLQQLSPGEGATS